MNAQIRVSDVVALSGQVGTVVESLGPDVFEVEFADNDGRTYAMLPLKSSQLLGCTISLRDGESAQK